MTTPRTCGDCIHQDWEHGQAICSRIDANAKPVRVLARWHSDPCLVVHDDFGCTLHDSGEPAEPDPDEVIDRVQKVVEDAAESIGDHWQVEILRRALRELENRHP